MFRQNFMQGKQTNLFQIILLLIAATFVTLFTFSPAQALTENKANTINVKPVKQFYPPESRVTVRALSRLVNLKNNKTTWKVDGEIVASGVGITEISVPTGKPGKRTKVTLELVLPSSGLVTKSTTLRPTEVDLIWEASESYTPPFYEGKALNPGWGNVSVTAIPHVYRNDGTKYNEDNLIYKWEYNNVVYGDKSGKGKNSLRIRMTPRANQLSVEIKTPDGDIVAHESLVFPSTGPKLVFYRHDPRYGTRISRAWNEGGQTLSRAMSVSAQPYYFLKESARAGSLAYQWEINGSEINPNTNKNQISLSRLSTGQHSVSLEVSDSSHLLFPAVEERFSVKIQQEELSTQ